MCVCAQVKFESRFCAICFLKINISVTIDDCSLIGLRLCNPLVFLEDLWSRFCQEYSV